MTLSVTIRHRQGDFSLDVAFAAEGGVTALFGASGSGKTSILRILGGLTRPDAGRILLEGDALLDTDRRLFIPAHRRRFGYVFQEPRLFPHLTVRQNLTYGRWFAGRAEVRADMERILDMLGSHVDENALISSLAVADKQMVEIAKAISRDARVIFMDEPTGGLDVSVQARLLDLVRGLVNDLGLAAIVVTHDLAVARLLSHRMMVMKEGHVIEHGLTDRVLDDPRQPYTQLLVSSILQV